MHWALLRPFSCSQRTQELATAFSEQVSVSLKAVHILSQLSVKHTRAGKPWSKPIVQSKDSSGLWAAQESESI